MADLIPSHSCPSSLPLAVPLPHIPFLWEAAWHGKGCGAEKK